MSKDIEVYSINETARLLKVSRSSVVKRIGSGKLAAVKFGKRILIPRASLDALLKIKSEY